MNKTYLPTMFINNQNRKAASTDIINVDTIRGCSNNCESCFAKRNCAITIKHFEIPVPILKYTGKIRPKSYYRVGNFGDPATDWTHSEKLMVKYKFQNFFGVTKLQSLVGFTGVFDKLQVSIDTINKEHFKITIKNVKILRKKFPDIKIALRVRSLDTLDKVILKRQQKAVDFANHFMLPILETKMRFVRKSALTIYKLNPETYSWRNSYLRSNVGQSLLKGVDRHYVCDIKEKKCKGCKLCVNLFW